MLRFSFCLVILNLSLKQCLSVVYEFVNSLSLFRVVAINALEKKNGCKNKIMDAPRVIQVSVYWT